MNDNTELNDSFAHLADWMSPLQKAVDDFIAMNEHDLTLHFSDGYCSLDPAT